jgi:hypothetical protein
MIYRTQVMAIWRVGNQIAKMIHDHLNDVLKNQIWTFLEQFYVTLKTFIHDLQYKHT